MALTKDKIFNVSVELFSKKGFSGVSVREIVKKVGIKESSLYNHFRSKEDILTKIFDYYQNEMEKTSLSEQYLEEIISEITVKEFWEKGLMNFQKATQNPVIQKISKIILLEMFRYERARDLALKEFFTRQQELVETIFGLMKKKRLIKNSLDPKFLATEYSYCLLALQFEHNILSNWKMSTEDVRRKMLDHIKFISEYSAKKDQV